MNGAHTRIIFYTYRKQVHYLCVCVCVCGVLSVDMYGRMCLLTTPPVPRPNVYVYMSPIHINFHQESCLWLAEFIHGVTATVNVGLAKTAVEEGNAYLVSLACFDKAYLVSLACLRRHTWVALPV